MRGVAVFVSSNLRDIWCGSGSDFCGLSIFCCSSCGPSLFRTSLQCPAEPRSLFLSFDPPSVIIDAGPPPGAPFSLGLVQRLAPLRPSLSLFSVLLPPCFASRRVACRVLSHSGPHIEFLGLIRSSPTSSAPPVSAITVPRG